MHVCVIGAGVTGVVSAYMLARQGVQVTLLDKQSGPAQVASYANGGQLSYSYVAPLAGPGVLPNVPGWLLRADSPLRFHPRPDPQQWRWMLAFMAACRADVAREATAQLLELAFLSRRELHALQAELKLDFHWKQNGKLVVFRSQAALEKARELVQYQAAFGAEQFVLGREAVLEKEPALAPLAGELAGAVYTPSEEVGDCHRFTVGLHQKLLALPGVTSHMNTAVHSLVREGRRVVAARTSAGDIAADAFVVAGGLGSVNLLRPLGYTPLLYGLKGYSLSVPASNGLAISVTDYEKRIVYAPIGQTLRMAAMIDIGVQGQGTERQRLATLKRQVADTFPQLNVAAAEEWVGERPATPTSKPVIGRSPVADNLWLNIGQGALGFTLACGSATLLCRQLRGEPAGALDSAFGA